MYKTIYRNDLDLINPTYSRTSTCLYFLFSFFLFLFSLFNPLSAQPHLPKIGVLQIVEHPALDESRRGIFDELKEQGFFTPPKNLKWIYENAQDNVALSAQISQRFVGIPVDIIITLGTKSTQAAIGISQDSEIPIVFVSVTDPVGAKILKNLQQPEGNVTGVSNLTPIAPQFKVFRELLPKLKRIGVVFNPGEANSVRLNELMVETGKEMGIEVITAAATKSSEVRTAALKLASNVDALFVNNDNTALAAFEAIVQVGNMANIPVFVSDTDMLARGGLAALGPNQYQLGRQVGKQVARLLRGDKVGEIPVEFAKKIELHLNMKTANNLGVSIPESIKGRAVKIL